MKRLMILGLSLFLVPGVFAGELAKAKKEGKVNLYANITAIEPIMEAFRASTGVDGIYTRVDTSKFLATVLTEYQA
ncbi:MAG TPA: ABC transporter substrate-binding protein, partial [Syntrophobacteraceae bacterium]|nr:ABC transporter substrate-binding protein [Syntrophobacteraceae bacterium]